MCDYSLHLVASRPAKVGDRLVATDFLKSITRGFAATWTIRTSTTTRSNSRAARS
jgi:hypothetical protein